MGEDTGYPLNFYIYLEINFKLIYILFITLTYIGVVGRNPKG